MYTDIVKINIAAGEESGPGPEDIQNAAAAKAAAELLRKGRIVAFPTDTVYGLGAVFNNAQAVRGIFEAKGRPENKPLSILVSDIKQLDMLAADIAPEAYILMKRFWPGALTLIFRKNDLAGIPEEVTAGGDTIGVRMPALKFARDLIDMTGMPLAAPSANLSGKRSSVSGQDVIEDLNGRVDMIIDGGACRLGLSSTVIDMSEGSIKLLRQGSISMDMIEAQLRS